MPEIPQTMTKEFAEEVIEQLDQMGFRAKVHESYSGRGMYGKSVIAITGDFPPLALASAVNMAAVSIYYNANEYDDMLVFMDEVYTSLMPKRQDQFGLDNVYY